MTTRVRFIRDNNNDPLVIEMVDPPFALYTVAPDIQASLETTHLRAFPFLNAGERKPSVKEISVYTVNPAH